jgi:Protein kinase domain
LLATGTIVAGYRVDSVLGEGGMAVVYRATQLSLNRVVALKLLAPELGEDEGFRERFRREGQLQASLDHLHIVPVYEAGPSEHGLFLAMRLIVGSTLKELIQHGELEPRRSLRLLAQAAQALDAAHEAGLIHRDVKPQNILIGAGDHVYLADFGLIKAPDEDRLTGTGQFMGTIDYVAPEQIQGEPATAASDCYSLTAVLFECLTNEVPFPRPSEVATLHAQITAPPPRVTERRPELPAALDEVIASGMAKDPAQRPASAAELMRAAARAFATGAPPSAQPTEPTPTLQETRRSPPPAAGTERADTTRGYGIQPAAAVSEGPAATEPTVLTRPAGDVAAEGPGRAGAIPPAQARRAGLGATGVGLLAVLAVAAAAAGFVLGHGGGSSGATKLPNFATAGHLQLRYPAGWQVSTASSPVPGMAFSDPVTITADRGASGVTAGEVPAGGGATLLAPGFRSRVEGALPERQAISLGGLQSYRFDGVTVRGLAGTLTVYAVPTSDGVATIACHQSTAAPAGFTDQCARVAATLRLVDTSAYPLGPSSAYAKLLTETFAGLRTAVTTPESDLRAARTQSAQATAAGQLAHAYDHAAAPLIAATLSPEVGDANAAVVAALHQLGAAYAAAAAAARSGSDAAYVRAGANISRAFSALRVAFKGLAQLGYPVAS